MSSKVNLFIYLAIWKRPEITELCFIGIERLKKHPKYNINVLAVISEPEMIPLCEKYEVIWILHENLPLGKKKNYGLAHLANFNFDYVMEIGSDDLITNDLLDLYLDYIDKYHFFGVSDAAYIESETGECRRLTYGASTYGAGRLMSRKLLEQMEWKIWDDNFNRGLDNSSIRRIKNKGFVYHKINPTETPCVIDIKSNENLWKFNYFLGEKYDINILYDKLSTAEVNKLKSLQNGS